VSGGLSEREVTLIREICADIEAISGLPDTQNRWAATLILQRARGMALDGRLDMAEQRQRAARALLPEVFNDD
jgi:hypothetical protein